MKKFRNKYRIPSARAQWWDYGWNGAYFITACTKNRKHYFGEIQNKKMVLSHTGVIADILWHEIPRHFSFVELGAFVVMPNHIHGILVLDKPVDGGAVELGRDVGPGDDVGSGVAAVETGHALSLTPQTPGQIRAGNQGKKTISSIVGGYKSAVTKHANRIGFENGWQTRFHDLQLLASREQRFHPPLAVSTEINL